MHAQTTTPQRPYCGKPGPAAACERFWVFELGYYAPIVATRAKESNGAFLRSQLTSEIGLMKNTGSRARGVLVSLGRAEAGPRLGLLARRRRWQGKSSVDLTAGVIKSSVEGLDPVGKGRPASGATAEIAANLNDVARLSVRGDVVRDSRGRNASALYVGGGVGSRSTPSVILLGVLLVVGGLVVYGAG